jgi:hypothetical protein
MKTIRTILSGPEYVFAIGDYVGRKLKVAISDCRCEILTFASPLPPSDSNPDGRGMVVNQARVELTFDESRCQHSDPAAELAEARRQIETLKYRLRYHGIKEDE